MKTGPGFEFTVIELKEILRKQRLTTSGSKCELIKRLSEHDPEVWRKQKARRRNALHGDDLGLEDMRQPTKGDVSVEAPETDDEAKGREEHESVASFPEKRNDAMRRELDESC